MNRASVVTIVFNNIIIYKPLTKFFILIQGDASLVQDIQFRDATISRLVLGGYLALIKMWL